MDGQPFRLPCLDLETNSCSDGHLSDIMPDVASSTVASSAIASMGQLQLDDAAPESLQLDLGDRPGHMTCGGPSGIDLRNPQVSCFFIKFLIFFLVGLSLTGLLGANDDFSLKVEVS